MIGHMGASSVGRRAKNAANLALQLLRRAALMHRSHVIPQIAMFVKYLLTFGASMDGGRIGFGVDAGVVR